MDSGIRGDGDSVRVASAGSAEKEPERFARATNQMNVCIMLVGFGCFLVSLVAGAGAHSMIEALHRDRELNGRVAAGIVSDWLCEDKDRRI